MTTKETKALAYRTLAQNRYAKRPEQVTPRQWAAIRSIMERRFSAEWMDTPAGLYTDEQIWKQTFQKYLK
jgi:hypothetical protein